MTGQTQRAAVLTEVGHIELADRGVPSPGNGQVLVKVAAVTVCGSDVHYYEHGRIGSFVMRAPLVLGHETSGVVAELGQGVTGPEVGTRVALEPQRTCGRCAQCRRGRYNLCPDVEFFATPPVDGAFCEYVCVDAERAHPVPDSLSDDAAALIEPLSVAVHACGKASIGPGSRVLISGAGPVGLLCLQVALASGATDVVVTDLNSDRLAIAGRFGASETVDVSHPDAAVSAGNADVVLECTGAATAVESSIRSAAPAATVVLIGMGGQPALPVEAVQRGELWVTGVFRYAHAYPAAIALAASAAIRLDELITSRHDLGGAVDALLAAQRDPAALKAVVYPGGPR